MGTRDKLMAMLKAKDEGNRQEFDKIISTLNSHDFDYLIKLSEALLDYCKDERYKVM